MNIYLFGLVLIVSIRFGQFVMVILYFPNIVDLHLNKTMYVSGNSKWLCATECTFTVRPYGRNTLVNIGNRISLDMSIEFIPGLGKSRMRALAAAVRLASTNKHLAAISLR